MEFFYYACDWIECLDKIDVYFIHENINKYDCQMALIGSLIDNDGNKILILAIKSKSQLSFQQFINEVGALYDAKSWYVIDENIYLSGKPILIDEKSRDYIYQSVTNIISYFKESYELHHQLVQNDDNYLIYQTDWLIKRPELDQLMEFFNIGEKILFSLAYIKIQDNRNYFYLRFFAVFTSPEIFENFIEKTRNVIRLMNWLKITKDNLPNIVYFNPQRTLDGYLQSKLNEELYLRSISNEKIIASTE